MKNTDNTPTLVEERVYALDDFTDSQLENLRRRLPHGNNFYRNGHWCRFGRVVSDPFLSGWKLHIPGENIAHSVYLYENLEWVLIKWRAIAKVGGELAYSDIKGYMIPPENPFWGKSGAAIYVPPGVFKDNHLQEFIDDILRATKDYHCEAKFLCAKHLCSHLYYRYEYPHQCDITVGIPKKLYKKLYINGDPGIPYKPSDVIDPFLTLVLPSC